MDLRVFVYDITQAQETDKRLKCDIEIQTLTSTNFEGIDQQIKSDASRYVGTAGIILYCTLCSNILGNYGTIWSNQLDRLKTYFNLYDDDCTLNDQALYHTLS